MSLRYLSKKDPNSDWCKDNLQGRVKNVETIEYSLVFQNKETQEREVVIRSVKHYNHVGYITESTEFDADNAAFQKEIYIFDKKGNRIEELLYNENNQLEQRTMVKYNAQRLPVSTIMEDCKGRKIQYFKYIYNELGNLTQLTGYDNRGKISEKSYYTYDSHGNLTKYMGFGQFDNQKIYYKYNSNRKITEQFCVDTKDNFIEKIIYQYENQGKREQRTHLDKNGGVLSVTVYVYDDFNNLLEFTHFDKNNAIIEHHEFVYQYDSKNNWTKQTFYYGTEKTIISINERIVEYYE